MSDFGKQLRLNRLVGRQNRKALIVAFDHALPLGPIPGTLNPGAQVRTFADAGVDGVLLNPGMLRHCVDSFIHPNAPSLIMRLDWTSLWSSLENGSKLTSELLATPEYALTSGADAVLTFLIIGSGDMAFEAREIARNAEIARECERLGIPLIVEALTRGEAIKYPSAPDHVKFHTRIASELGADLIKTEYTGDVDSMAEVVQISPVPILVLGGARKASDDESLASIRDAVQAGAAGVFFGRNVFQSPDIYEFVRCACEVLSGAAYSTANAQLSS